MQQCAATKVITRGILVQYPLCEEFPLASVSLHQPRVHRLGKGYFSLTTGGCQEVAAQVTLGLGDSSRKGDLMCT